ncbi:MAG: Polysaccharide biosynthesis/export protein [candidate division BRC1 bacterium ADurb.BinA364]|nr:MAG: Polysaccharide biosynthesis/export protein [candidate division BRC1 bacterium ADurb.BinA364]
MTSFSRELRCLCRVCAPRPALARKGAPRVLLLLALACLTGCAPAYLKKATPYAPGLLPDAYEVALDKVIAAQQEETQSGTYTYRIEPTDLLGISVYQQPDMAVETRVGVDGQIRFPPLGSMRAAGLTERELELAIEEKLRGDYLPDPHVTATVLESSVGKVAVIGAVGSPGLKPLWGEKTLLDFLAEAGGLTSLAGPVAYVTRGPMWSRSYDEATSSSLSNTQFQNKAQSLFSKTLEVHLHGLMFRGDRRWNVRIRPGDTISVPAVSGFVYITGSGIENPGTYPLMGTVSSLAIGSMPLTMQMKTLRQVIDEAGGLNFQARREIVLIRRNADTGAKQYLLLNYNKLVEDDEYDIALQTGDRIITGTSISRRLAWHLKEIMKTFGFSYSMSDSSDPIRPKSLSTSVGLDSVFVSP